MRRHNKWTLLRELKMFLLLYGMIFNPIVSMQVQASSSDKVQLELAPSLSPPVDTDCAQLSADLEPNPFFLDSATSRAVAVFGAAYLEGAANQLEGNSAYTAYKKNIAGRRGQLYVSGNAGMLHAFDSKTGEETFVFTPAEESIELHKPSEQNYNHKAHTGGKPVIAEVYDGWQWRTILVSTLVTAGTGLFALDITNPDAITLLWELNASAETRKGLATGLGYSLAGPTVARLHNGQWAVVIGNGYNASGAHTGAAALYLLDAMDGSLIKSLPVQSDLAQPNGLSSPRLADYDGDGIADYAYAGDLHGNLWRFDLLGDGATPPTLTPPHLGSYGVKAGSSTSFNVSYAGKPLFTATATANGVRQPITAAPSLVRHPTRKGYLVIAGTGQYFASADDTASTTYAHSLYGIWDMQTKAQITNADTVIREQLASQSITSETISIGQTTGQQREARIISNNSVEWHTNYDSAQPVKQRGWRLDFQNSSQAGGEGLIDNMHTLGSMLLLQTLVPATDPCGTDSSRWLYAINPASGGSVLHHVFADHMVDSGAVTALKFNTPDSVSIHQNEQGFSVQTADEKELIAVPPESIGRQSWRMIAEP